jgi:hypothetical protein
MLTRSFATQNPELTAEQATILDKVRASALEYTDRLPDFICTQITRREITNQVSFGAPFVGAASSSGPRGPASAVHGSGARSDEIEEKVSFFNQTEHYEVAEVNGKKVTGLEHMKFAGAISAGEFGSALHNIFDPRSHTTFSWDRKTKLDGRSVLVFKFQVPEENGTIVMDRDTDQKIYAAYSGKLFIDSDSFQVLRITSELDLPIDFPVKSGMTSVDYRPVTIAGKTYTLPSRSEVRLSDSSRLYVNRIQFRDYHKFAVQSTIHYDSEGSQPK